jgi:hypothetical protein
LQALTRLTTVHCGFGTQIARAKIKDFLKR